MIFSRSGIGYLLLLLAALSTWCWARIKPSTIASFGVLIRYLMQWRTNRIALIAIWWWLGWHFLGSPLSMS